MQDPNDIFFYRPLPAVDVCTLFEVKKEGDRLRVKSAYANCLFSNLSADAFGATYNDYRRYLNIDFSPVEVNGASYALSPEEQEELTQQIITTHIYVYTINNMPVIVKRDDFLHPQTTDKVIWLMDRKFKQQDCGPALRLGARLLRRDYDDYCRSVKGRRMYYDR